MKVLVVFGTRPEAIKLIPVVKELESDSRFEVRVCVTGQHREMLAQVLSFFAVVPDYDLDLMRENQGLSGLAAGILQGIDPVLKELKPDWIIVQGDTTTAFGAALAGYYNGVQVGHVEAGLRTGDLYSPWPEEGNRQLIGSLAGLHFAPTEDSKANLLAENIPAERVVVTANTVIDALFLTRDTIKKESRLRHELNVAFHYLDSSKKLILVTNHRRESFGDGLKGICMALKELAQQDGVELLYPVHPNPNVRGPVHEMLGNVPNIHLIDPLDYPAFVYAMMRSHFVVSDSGGVQEEAPALGKPVLITREVTERPEGIMAGCTKLVGTDTETIVREAVALLHDDAAHACMTGAGSLYGDGEASARIRMALLRHAGLAVAEDYQVASG